MGRLLVAVFVGIVASSLVPRSVPWQLRGVVGWDVFSLSLLGLVWTVIGRATCDETKARAASEDPGRTTVWFLALTSSTFSLFAGIFVLRKVRDFGVQGSLCWGALAVLAVVLAWALTHSSYTLRYAHLYYRGESAGGIEFPGDEPPADIDFAYFAFTIGMCFQVSDVAVSDRQIRRTVLGHSILSFVYNTMVVGLVLNLLFNVLN